MNLDKSSNWECNTSWEKKTFLVIRAQTSSSTQSVTWNQFSLVFDHQERWLLYFTEYFTINLWLNIHVKLVAFPLFLHPITRAGFSFVCPLVLAAAGTFSRLLSSCSFSVLHLSTHPINRITHFRTRRKQRQRLHLETNNCQVVGGDGDGEAESGI